MAIGFWDEWGWGFAMGDGDDGFGMRGDGDDWFGMREDWLSVFGMRGGEDDGSMAAWLARFRLDNGGVTGSNCIQLRWIQYEV